jgi:hypothetical protein
MKFGLLLSVFTTAALGFWAIVVFGVDANKSDSARVAETGNRPIPNYALDVVSGESGGTIWSVWLFGEDGNNCWATKSGRRFPVEETYCGYGVPPRYWQLIAEGPIGESRQNRSIFVFLTRDDVGRLDVLTDSGREKGRKRRLSWTRVQAQVINTVQARKAHLHGVVGYAAAVVQGTPCVRQIAIFNHTGKQIRRTPLWPCKHHETEYPLGL